MIAFYLIAIIIGVAAQKVTKKEFNRICGGSGAYFFSLISSAVALLFFLLTSSQLCFTPDVVPYALAFAVSYAMGTVGAVLAFSCGPLSLTSLFISYSQILPILYGLIFLHEPISPTLVLGLVLLALSLLLCNKQAEHVSVTPKWVISVLLAFLGNGLCSTIQQMQQKAHGGQYKNECMILALSVVVAFLLVMTVIKERDKLTTLWKKSWWTGIVCGGMSGMVNLFVMTLGALMPLSIMFAAVSGGGLILTLLLSRILYREKLSARQHVGFALGVACVILLNL